MRGKPASMLWRIATALLTFGLVACGGGSGGDSPPALGNQIPTTPIALSGAGAAAGETGLAVVSITRTSETKITETVFEYVFTVEAKNGPAPTIAGRMEVTGSGAGTTVVDGVVVVGDVSANAQVLSTDTITLRHDRSVPFAAASLVWKVTPTPEMFTTEVTLQQLGVVSVDYASGQSGLYVMAGGSISHRIALSLAQGSSAGDFRVNLAPGTGGDAFSTIPSADGTQLTVNAAGLMANETATAVLKVTRISTRQHAVVPVSAVVVEVIERRATTVGATGGETVTALGTLRFSSNQLQESVDASVAIAAMPDGGHQIEVTFARDISNDGISIVLPSPPISDETTSAAQALSTRKMRTSAAGRTGASATATEPLPKDCTPVLQDGSYSVAKNLGALVLDRVGYFVGGMRVSPSYKVVAKKTTNIVQEPASLLYAAVVSKGKCASALDMLAAIDWSRYEPVLFVHGYINGSKPGGGSDTWEKFPRLAVQTGAGLDPSNRKQLIPFEFRWRTNADMKMVASDLGRAINFIHRRSGKAVHLVAHSFGGVLSRTLLQGLAPDIDNVITGKMGEARSAIADLTSLGSPYSGIMPEDSNVQLSIASVALPKGRHGIFIDACFQVSCHQMGEETTAVTDAAYKLGYTADELRPGGLAAELALTSDRLPSIPILVGIGLTISDGKFDDGDHLIRFAGQRFTNPGTELFGNLAALLSNASVGAATVSEVVLGANSSARPQANAPQILATRRPNGYIHSGVMATDGGGHQGLWRGTSR